LWYTKIQASVLRVDQATAGLALSVTSTIRVTGRTGARPPRPANGLTENAELRALITGRREDDVQVGQEDRGTGRRDLDASPAFRSPRCQAGQLALDRHCVKKIAKNIRGK
jgi:hypothetical protein